MSSRSTGHWFNFGFFGSSWWPWGGSDGREEETGRISKALKTGCLGGWHGGWDSSQATLQVPLSTYVTPLEFPRPHFPRDCSQKNENHCAASSTAPSNTHTTNSFFKLSIKEQRKITCEPVTYPPPVFLGFFVFFKPWASVMVSMFTFLERGAGERRKWANNQLFNTVLTFAFLCTVLCQALDIYLKKKKLISPWTSVQNQIGWRV